MTKIIVDETLLEYLSQEKVLSLRTDFVIIPCASIDQALTIHEKEIAELILIDFDMPGMNIEDFCARVRANERLKYTSIVVASPNRGENLDECLKSGVNAIVIKPVDDQELINTVTKLLQVKKREEIRGLMKISVTGKTNKTFYATSQNISVSGILIETDKYMSNGDQVSIVFYIQTNKIEINGEVVRKTENMDNFFQYGIRFLSIDAHSRTLIENFVKMYEDL